MHVVAFWLYFVVARLAIQLFNIFAINLFIKGNETVHFLCVAAVAIKNMV